MVEGVQWSPCTTTTYCAAESVMGSGPPIRSEPVKIKIIWIIVVVKLRPVQPIYLHYVANYRSVEAVGV